MRQTIPTASDQERAVELLAGHPWRRFVVLGDSVAEGLCEPVDGYSNLQWADRIAAELRAVQPELVYRNLGVSGLRTREILATQLEPALVFGPDLALVVGGGNDAFPATYDADRVDRELTLMITTLQDAGADVMTLGMFDISYSPAVADWLRPGLRQRMRTLSDRTAALAGQVQHHPHPSDRPPPVHRPRPSTAATAATATPAATPSPPPKPSALLAATS